MADESSAAATGNEDNDSSPFSPEDLMTEADLKARAAAAPKAEEPKQDDEEEDFGDEYDFDPASIKFDIPDKDKPKEETATPEKKEESAEEKEKKEKGGAESKSSQEPPKPDKAAEATEEKEEEKPAPQTLSKIKIGDKEHEMPEEAAEAVTEVVEKAKRIQDQAQGFAKDLINGRHYEVYLNLLARTKYGGNRDAAYEQMVQEAAELVNREIEFRKLPQDRQDAIRAQKKAEALEARLKQIEEDRQTEAKRTKVAQDAERLMATVTREMSKLGIPLTAENKDVAFSAASDLQLAAQSGGRPDVSQIVRRAKQQLDDKRAEFDRRLQARFESLPPQELLKQYPALAERLIAANREKLKAERAAAKTAAESAGPPAEQDKTPPRSKRKILTAEQWEDHWR